MATGWLTGLQPHRIQRSLGFIVKYNHTKDRFKIKHDQGCHWVKANNLLTPFQFAIDRIENAPSTFRSAKRYAVKGPSGRVITFAGPTMLVELRLRRGNTIKQTCLKMKGVPTEDRVVQLRKAFNYVSKTSRHIIGRQQKFRQYPMV